MKIITILLFFNSLVFSNDNFTTKVDVSRWVEEGLRDFNYPPLDKQARIKGNFSVRFDVENGIITSYSDCLYPKGDCLDLLGLKDQVRNTIKEWSFPKKGYYHFTFRFNFELKNNTNIVRKRVPFYKYIYRKFRKYPTFTLIEACSDSGRTNIFVKNVFDTHHNVFAIDVEIDSDSYCPKA